MEKRLLKKICPECGKVIESLYPGQLDYNFKAHRIICEQKQNKKEDDENDNKKNC